VDTLNPDYIDTLSHELETQTIDVLIFRMIYKDKRVYPLPGATDFEVGYVGISFCLKTPLAKEFLFVPSAIEDFDLLDRLRSAKKVIRISDYIGYNVEP
jgi:hypothetical protein